LRPRRKNDAQPTGGVRHADDGCKGDSRLPGGVLDRSGPGAQDLTPESRSAQRFSSSRALPADEDVIVYREPSGFVITPRSEVRDHPGRNALFRALLPHDH